MQRPGGDVPCALCGGVEVDLSTLVPTETVSFEVLSYSHNDILFQFKFRENKMPVFVNFLCKVVQFCTPLPNHHRW